MKKEVFEELCESVRQAGAIRRGEAKPSRMFEVAPQDVRSIRRRFSASQAGFAGIIGVSVDTIQNWEQGRCSPTGPARVLLTIADRNPALLSETLGTPRRASRKRSAVLA